MKRIADAFWRAVIECLHWRVMLWSLLPLAVAGASTGLLGWLYWESAVGTVRATLERWELVAAAMRWLDSLGGAHLHALIAPLIVVALSVPAVVLVSLLLVAWLATPAISAQVVRRRFRGLERRQGAGWWAGFGWSLACTAAALVALVLSVPLWFVPPFVALLPPLIWGWLTSRVLAFDVLAAHASAEERRTLLRRHRGALLVMGIACGYLGALPSLIWAASAATLILAPLLVVVSVWLYTVVFVFAACWFAHYALAALARLRETASTAPPAAPLLREPASASEGTLA